MRLITIAGRGWLSLRKPFAVNLDELPGVLCAVIGKNGEGKSSFLELSVGGALYRKLPTRGAQKGASNLTAFAVDRDAFIQVGLANGAGEFVIKQTVNGVSGKAEATVTDANGEELNKSAKTDTYMEWAEKNLPSPTVVYISQFIKQRDEGFADLDAAKRKSAVLKGLGIDRWEIMASLAGKKAKAVLEGEPGENNGLTFYEAVLTSFGDLATADLLVVTRDVSERLLIARSHVDDAQKSLADAQERVDSITTERDTATKTITANQKARDAITTARARVEELEKRRDDLTTRIASFNATLGRGEEIAKLRERYDQLTALIVEKDEALRKNETELTRRESALSSLMSSERTQGLAIEACQVRIDAAIAKQNEREACEKAQADLPAAEAKHKEWETKLTEAREAQALLTEKRFDTEAGRIQSLRTGINTAIGISDGAEVVGDRSEAVVTTLRTTITHDDDQVKGASEYPRQVSEARKQIDLAEKAERQARANVEALRRTADRLKDIEGAADVEKYERMEQEKLRSALAETITDKTNHETIVRDLREDARRLDFERSGLMESRNTLGDVEDLEKSILTARATVTELEQQRQIVADAIVVTTAEADLLPTPPADPTLPDDSEARRALSEVNVALLRAQLEQGEAERNETDVFAKAARVEELRGTVARLRDEHAQWTRLQAELGKNGLQAMEIDAAGPELTDTVNDLLHHCVGSRWSVEMQTSRDSGKKVLEDFEIIVYDSQADSEQKRRAELRLKSGGERVLIGETVAVALSMMSCRRSGVVGPTLIRDESGAALDAEHAPQYIAILRRAAERSGASKVLYVAHNRQMQLLADSWIEINDGTVTAWPSMPPSLNQ